MTVDPNVVGTWSERLPDSCRGFDPEDRFNAYETDLLWKATPTQTMCCLNNGYEKSTAR